MTRVFALAAALALMGCAAQTATAPSSPPADLASGAGDDWISPGGDAGKSHFSRLTDIRPDNVGTLGLAWAYDMGSARVQEATPVVVGGTMFTSGNLGRVYALDATTGRELWTFRPPLDMQVNRSACCDQANRGVAVAQGKVFVAALDGKLYALDQLSGQVAWSVDTIADHSRGYTSTGAPEVAGDVVVIGNAGAEYDTRGYVTAYRIADGGQAWRFYTVPRDPRLGPQESPALEAAIKGWDPKSEWDKGGGGTPWDAINFDPETDTVFVGVGNGGPYPQFQRSPSRGDNLYLSSIVALDPKTGALKWHYQETPQDSWDFTATQPMILARMTVAGRSRPVIIHSPKNGFLFVIDRETGKPIAINPLVRTSWASGYDPKTGRPNLTPETSDYASGPKIVFPGSPGARNWYPAAWDAGRGLYFASVLDMGNLMWTNPGPPAPRKPKALNAGASLIFTPDLEEILPALPPPLRDAVAKLQQMQWVKDDPGFSEIRAIDPLTGKARWNVRAEGWQDRNGMLATASGLLIHGTVGGKLVVRSSDTGTILKEIDTGSSIMAAPMTYRVDGIQYVAIQTGWGGGGWGFIPPYAAAYTRLNTNRILVFRLGGNKDLAKPAQRPALTVAPVPPVQAGGVTPGTIARGNGLYLENCAICHASQQRTIAPDLRRLSPVVHENFANIVLKGLLVPGGMPRWDDVLSPSNVAAIHAYLIDEQGKTRARELELQRQGKPLDTRAATVLSNF